MEYFGDVFRYLRGLTANETLAEELTSETFFKAMKKCNARPVRILTEKLSYLFKRKFAEHPQCEHLAVRFGQSMQAFMKSKGSVLYFGFKRVI